MALYNKWDVKNDFAWVLQFSSLISDGLGGVTYLRPLLILWFRAIAPIVWRVMELLTLYTKLSILISETMPNFWCCHAMPIHRLTPFSLNPFFFCKIKLILYPRVGNSTTHLTLMALLCCTIFSIYTNNLKDILMAKVDVTAPSVVLLDYTHYLM
jgi:hypothetical protein